MQVVSDHAPDGEIVLVFDEARRVNAVLGQQFDHAATTVKPLDREFVVQQRQHNALVFGVQAAVDQQGVALVNTGPGHGVAFDPEQKRGLFVAYEVLVQVYALAGVIRRR